MWLFLWEGVSKSLRPFFLKTDGPLRANFRRIKMIGIEIEVELYGWMFILVEKVSG